MYAHIDSTQNDIDFAASIVADGQLSGARSLLGGGSTFEIEQRIAARQWGLGFELACGVALSAVSLGAFLLTVVGG